MGVWPIVPSGKASTMKLEIVKTGTWMYDKTVEKRVDIIALDFDFWYEIAKSDDRLEPSEAPQALDKNGRLYYSRFSSTGETDLPTWVDSVAYKEIARAMTGAEKKVTGGIRWQE